MRDPFALQLSLGECQGARTSCTVPSKPTLSMFMLPTASGLSKVGYDYRYNLSDGLSV